MPESVVITAAGILSAIGKGTGATLQSLRAGRAGVRYPVYLQTVHATDFLLGEVPYSNAELTAMLAPNQLSGNGYTRTTLLAINAIQELLLQTDTDLLRSEPLALINANTVGGMCSVEDMYEDFITPGKTGQFIRYIDTLDCAESTERATAYFGLKPFTATISTACSSSANAIILGARMIRQGLVKRAICGGCDALSRFTLNGFNSLKNVDKQPCRPFDNDRFGLNLGEGAGYVLLEREEDARARNATILARFSGYCNSNDAYHPTAPSPDGAGAYRTMVGALAKARLQPGDIGYINAHGTATITNDAAEGLAIQNLFGESSYPYFSSTKPFTGHTLAAAGAVEAIFSIMSLQEETAFANLNFTTPMQELAIRPVTENTHIAGLKHVMSNSFGFGGNNVSLIFSKS
ncbi:beta-ketoacyl-[acyl-carrier-protein] synthase family protein [Chitinophagaceae bacterium MMS25-I14]